MLPRFRIDVPCNPGAALGIDLAESNIKSARRGAPQCGSLRGAKACRTPVLCRVGVIRTDEYTEVSIINQLLEDRRRQ
jgi:hypothetical protein